MTLVLRTLYTAAVMAAIVALLSRGQPGGAIAVFAAGMLLRQSVENGRLTRLAARSRARRG